VAGRHDVWTLDIWTFGASSFVEQGRSAMKNRILNSFALTILVTLAFTSCASDEQPAADNSLQSVEPGLAAAPNVSVGGISTSEDCPGTIDCPGFDNCTPFGDIDCGDEFCRTPGQQCGGQPSTFIRVSHVSICTDPVGNVCVAIRQGRRLVHCGC
jgi:hypothetical protein